MADNVKHPNHYIRGGLECIQVIKAAVTGLVGYEAVCTSQVIKYICGGNSRTVERT